MNAYSGLSLPPGTPQALLEAPPHLVLQALAELRRQREQTAERDRLARDADAIRERCRTLIGFVREAWHVLEPRTVFLEGWATRAICDHLEAITHGRFLAMGLPNKVRFNVPPGMTKALDHDTPVFTTHGWKRHGDLLPGDFVFGPDGQPKRVLACSAERIEPAYAVQFDDRSEIIAGGDHQWAVERDVASVSPRYSRGRKLAVVSTLDLRGSGYKRGESERRPDRVTLTEAVQMPPKRLLIDPYVLGAWLGDGSSTSGMIYAGAQDAAHFSALGRVSAILPAAGTRKQDFYHILVDGLQVRLRMLGILRNKHIPDDYLEASADQRWELLRGLMDTDGHCAKNGNCFFANKSEQIARAFHQLACSLGLKPGLTSHRASLNGRDYGLHYRISFVPPGGAVVFRLARKQALVRGNLNGRSRNRYVMAVLPVGPRRVKCIQVEGNMYLAGQAFVPTHNSMLVSVMWNAWEWGPCNMAHLRHLSTSWSADYVKRDTRKTRDLILSEWFQTLWPHVKLTRVAETSFENRQKGTREGVAFDGLTGGRGDRLTIDDPLSVPGAKSDADRGHAEFIMRESVPSRVNNPEESATALIMQRVHMDDPSGVWEKVGVRHVALVLPMRFEVARRCVTPIFTDPRTIEGELIFPERFSRPVVDALEKEMTAYAVSGQNQQRPVPREGGMFKRPWFKAIEKLPPGYRWVRHWDLADTEETYTADPPYTAGILLGKSNTLPVRYCIGDAVRLREESPMVRKTVRATAEADRIRLRAIGGSYEVQVPQDPGSAGKTVARDMLSMLDGFNAHKLIETGSKIDRAEPMATQAENGNVDYVVGAWNDVFFEEVTNFPGTKFKDQTDGMTGGYARLQIKRRGKPVPNSNPLPIYGR